MNFCDEIRFYCVFIFMSDFCCCVRDVRLHNVVYCYIVLLLHKVCAYLLFLWCVCWAAEVSTQLFAEILYPVGERERRATPASEVFRLARKVS